MTYQYRLSEEWKERKPARGRGGKRNVFKSKTHSLSPEMIQKSKVKREAGQGRGSVAARYESDTQKEDIRKARLIQGCIVTGQLLERKGLHKEKKMT